MFKVTPGAWVKAINAFIWWQITDLYQVRRNPQIKQIVIITARFYFVEMIAITRKRTTVFVTIVFQSNNAYLYPFR